MKATPPKDEYINTPVRPEVKAALRERAAENGRAIGREASLILTKAVMRGKTQENQP